MLQVVLFQVGDHGVTEAPGFQGDQVVLLTPHLIDGVEVFGADAGIRLEPNVVLGLHEVKEVVVVPLDQLPVLPGSVALGELEAILDQTLQALKSPQENPFGLGGHLLSDVWIIHPVSGLVLGSQNQLPPVEAIASVIQGLQITIAECQQPSIHPALVALLAFPLQVHLTLGGDNGFDIVGLPQGFHPHIVVHAEQDVLQVSPGKAVLRDFADAAVLHVGAEQLGQDHADLTLAFATPTFDNHHPLALVAGNQAVPDKLLDCGDIFRIEEVGQEPQPMGGLDSFGVIFDRQPVADHFRFALLKTAVQIQGAVGQVDAVGDWTEVIHLGRKPEQVQNVAHLAGYVAAGIVPQLLINHAAQRHLVGDATIFGKEKAVAENDFVCGHEGLAKNSFVDPVTFFQPNGVIGTGPVCFAFHAASFALRISRRASILGRS